MAETYTSNLGLVKPDYDSPADISVINSNMDKIDNAVADAGKVKSVNNKTGDVTLTAADVGALGKNETAANANALNGKSAEYYATAESISDSWASGKTYAVRDYVIYGNRLYKCKTAHTAGGVFSSDYWDKVTICDEFVSKIVTLPVNNTYFTTESVQYEQIGKVVFLNASLNRNDTVMPSSYRGQVWVSGLPKPKKELFFYCNQYASNNFYRYALTADGNITNAYSVLPVNATIGISIVYFAK